LTVAKKISLPELEKEEKFKKPTGEFCDPLASWPEYLPEDQSTGDVAAQHAQMGLKCCPGTDANCCAFMSEEQKKHQEAAQTKYEDFFAAGGRVIVAPDQETVAAAAEAGQRPNWSVGIHPGDFLVPVCHQGMNRSQVMRLALTGVVS
tara:strand:+ start:66 stop:509 length:444 start_codon:yes stop_codon:yes gene_type:complete